MNTLDSNINTNQRTISVKPVCEYKKFCDEKGKTLNPNCYLQGDKSCGKYYSILIKNSELNRRNNQ